MKLGRTRRVHFVGIGGIGMSGIAELLANLGYEVSGSDQKASAVTARLETLGVRVHVGHDAANVGAADVVVVSSAVKPANPEVVEARRTHVPVIPRAEMLAELMRLKTGIAIAGAHGKTSTTSMAALVLERGGLDPTAVIGGRLSAFGSNARLGQGEYVVAEADESDGSFLKLSPVVAVITNVDREHLDHYGTFEKVVDAFVEFANRVPFYGAAIVCVDDPVLASIAPTLTRRVVTYGLDRDADLAGREVELGPFSAKARVERHGTTLGRLALSVPGRHNVQNALAAVAVGLELGMPFDTIASALSAFRGAERRFQLVGERAGVMVVDDYGHHPTEIAAVIAAARAGLDRRVVLAFQPHRYSRTEHLLEQFGEALSRADLVLVTDIYAAGEDARPGVSAAAVVDAVARHGGTPAKAIGPVDGVPDAVAAVARAGDLVITLGAGSIGAMGERILALLDDGHRAAAEVRA